MRQDFNNNSKSHLNLKAIFQVFVSSTYLSLDKMDAIAKYIFFRWIFVNEKFRIVIKISLKFVPKVQIYSI